MAVWVIGLPTSAGSISNCSQVRPGTFISACKRNNKYVGICGQGPSDYPDLAKWLLEQGIESMSLNPDTVVSTWLYLAGKKV